VSLTRSNQLHTVSIILQIGAYVEYSAPM